MKKLLGYFGSFILIGTPMLSTISCNKSKTNNKNNGKNKDDENITDENNENDNKDIDSGFEYEDEKELSVQEKEIIKNTGFFTKLLLLSRHENLNFNVNEVLSSIFAPKTTWNSFPRLYYINGKKYDLTEYSDKLTTDYSNLSRLNATHFKAFLPSNFVGMYKDKLYTNYVNDIKENADSTVAFEYDRRDIIFPDDKNRQQLAWANFTGPLSKYIIDNNLFTYYKDEYDIMGAGRILDQINSAKSPQKVVLTDDKTACKVKDGLDLPIKIEDSFGSLQQSIFSRQVKANFFSKILDFMPFIQNFNASSTGSIYGLRLLNSIFPFTDTESNQDSVYVIFLALEKMCNWLSNFVNMNERNKVAEYKSAELKDSWNKINSGLKVNGKKFLDLITGSGIKFKVQSLMNKDKTSIFDTLKQFVIDANKSFVYWTVEDIKAFKKYVITQLGFLGTVASKLLPKIPIKEVFEKMIEFFGKDDNSSIELIKG